MTADLQREALPETSFCAGNRAVMDAVVRTAHPQWAVKTFCTVLMRFSMAAAIEGAADGFAAASSAASIVRLLIFALTGDVSSPNCSTYSCRNSSSAAMACRCGHK